MVKPAQEINALKARQYYFMLLALLMPVALLADVTEVDNDALQLLHARGVTIIDVRRQDEWEQTGLVPGSHAITFFDEKGRYDVRQWLDQVSRITSPDKPVVLICAHGVRSSKIAELLDKRLGYADVHNVTEGIVSWIKSNNPVEPWES